MAITRAQQYKQMLQKGGRIGLRNGPPGGGDPGMKYNAPNPREDRRGGQYTPPEAKAVVTRQQLNDIVNQGPGSDVEKIDPPVDRRNAIEKLWTLTNNLAL